MPDYSDDEIDKVSDDVSESDEVLIDGKPVKSKGKSGSDNENVSTLKALFFYFKLNLIKKMYSLF